MKKIIIYESEVKVFLLKNLVEAEALQKVTYFIDQAFLQKDNWKEYHNENKYKEYSFKSFYPIEKNKVYKAGNIYTIQIRTSSKELKEYLESTLPNITTEEIKGLVIKSRTINQKYIDKLISITPAITKFDDGYWKVNHTIEEFEKRLKENLIKKYNKLYYDKLEENFEFFTKIYFKNNSPIKTKYKNISLLGDKIELTIATNPTAQNLAYFALGVGLLELNGRGFGNVNAIWL